MRANATDASGDPPIDDRGRPRRFVSFRVGRPEAGGMSDNGDEEADEPVVELGDGDDVEGAPVARVASRLFFPIEKSEVLRREGETTVRTPDGPQSVQEILDGSDEVYFETNSDLVNTVESVVGTGPVPTVGGGSESNGADTDTDADGETAADEGEFEFDDGDDGDAADSDAGDSDAADTDATGAEDDAGAEDADADGTDDAEDADEA